jgi:hypothetical protein
VLRVSNLELELEFLRNVLGVLSKSSSYFKGVLEEERLSNN